MNTNALALQRAVAITGSQSELARRIGVRQGYVWKWLRSKKVPAERCAAIERATGGAVTREQLRPDIFGPAPSDKDH
jgi:DNA-binding transcriptional regulator YdaS (Cro superfamily)